MTVYVNKI